MMFCKSFKKGADDRLVEEVELPAREGSHLLGRAGCDRESITPICTYFWNGHMGQNSTEIMKVLKHSLQSDSAHKHFQGTQCLLLQSISSVFHLGVNPRRRCHQSVLRSEGVISMLL